MSIPGQALRRLSLICAESSSSPNGTALADSKDPGAAPAAWRAAFAASCGGTPAVARGEVTSTAPAA
eukprot:3302662-Amphidinium_carterae.1